MSTAVWKFSLQRIIGPQKLEMPEAAAILHASMQNGTPCIWAIVNPNAPKVDRHFVVKGTGHSLEGVGYGSYVGTVFDGPFVWHIFEVLD